MRCTLIQCSRSFVNLDLLPTELAVVVEALVALTAQYLQIHRLSHIFGVERPREDVR